MSRPPRPRARLGSLRLPGVGLALFVSCLHTSLLLIELTVWGWGPGTQLTVSSAAWWWSATGYQVVRGQRITPSERFVVLTGHAVSFTVVGLLSDVAGEPVACAMGLVALPLSAALSQPTRTVVLTLAMSCAGASSIVLAATEPLPLGIYCSVAVLMTTLMPTVLYLRLRRAL